MKPTVIALVNQKGGVGKSVSMVNLGIGLAQLSKRVLVTDNDPQSSLTISLGYQQPDFPARHSIRPNGQGIVDWFAPVKVLKHRLGCSMKKLLLDKLLCHPILRLEVRPPWTMEHNQHQKRICTNPLYPSMHLCSMDAPLFLLTIYQLLHQNLFGRNQ